MGCNGSKATAVSKEQGGGQQQQEQQQQQQPSSAPSQSQTANVFIVFVLGGPGSGKGTQCAKIAEEFGFKHVSTGDLFRDEVKKDSPRAEKVKEIMKEGKLIPTELTLEILADAMESLVAASGSDIKVLLDGFPREISQVHDFKKKFERDCNFALYFDVPAEVMKDRCLKRGQSSGRSDDNEETIAQRVETYFTKSKPVVHHFEQAGLLKRVSQLDVVDGSERKTRRGG
ncbi:cytidylate kinase [Salpingoeca rosetta]|uniref:Cytidylate kinase n=1 Tax=Salpingoeca rosetta (strain ATCC 50818 / BSB-021) TaxID=946362 RepID=F2U3R3_SALR5|nr:cytidylate kinase [Salpingoeca rosetta]EGD82257.1 cytidylate kinase [Salpingoeca rosetta]|eukprot:XP_004996440.1 cytidylate kinase [Salpingoeca rosetta]